MFYLSCVSLLLSACREKHYNLISTTKRKIGFSDTGYLKVLGFDNADCNLKCKNQITFVAVNNNTFKVSAPFIINYRFYDHDSLANRVYILKPGDSINIACDCNTDVQPLQANTTDWYLDITIDGPTRIQ